MEDRIDAVLATQGWCPCNPGRTYKTTTFKSSVAHTKTAKHQEWVAAGGPNVERNRIRTNLLEQDARLHECRLKEEERIRQAMDTLSTHEALAREVVMLRDRVKLLEDEHYNQY